MGSKNTLVEILDEFADLESRDVTAEDIYPFSEWQVEMVAKIIATLPDIKADIETKQQFAWDIAEEIYYIEEIAAYETELPSKKAALLREAKKTKEQLMKFHKLWKQSKISVGNLTTHPRNSITTNGFSLKDVLNYFDRFIDVLTKLNSRSGKGYRTFDSIKAQIIADFIINRWMLYFGEPPKSGGGRKSEYTDEKKVTNFDMLCDLLKVSYHARSLALKKKSGGMQKP